MSFNGIRRSAFITMKQIPVGVKVYPLHVTNSRFWIGKPQKLTRAVTINYSVPQMVPLDVVEQFPRFADMESWSYYRFPIPVREKGKPKKVAIVGFIFYTTSLVST